MLKTTKNWKILEKWLTKYPDYGIIRLTSNTCRKGRDGNRKDCCIAGFQFNYLPCSCRVLGFTDQADTKLVDWFMVYCRIWIVYYRLWLDGSLWISGSKRCHSWYFFSIFSLPHDGSRRYQMHGSNLWVSGFYFRFPGNWNRNVNWSRLVFRKTALPKEVMGTA